MRGLVTANSTGRGTVPRGSVAMVAISAPAGTRFTTFRWAGSLRRRDCRYALQLYAEGPGIKPIPIKNVRANQHCPRRARAQAAGYRSRTFNVDGATRIVQRVICEGGGGRSSCSARGTNYIRTYQAEVGIADEQPPTATIAGDTPLATGAWVSGSQPLNYDAQDNVGVRHATVIGGDHVGRYDQRPCALARPEGAFATGVPCPNGAGQITVDTRRLSEGTQPLVVQAQDTAGNVGDSAPVTARIDNTAPAAGERRVEGGDAWRNSNDFALTWTNPPEIDRAPIAAAAYKLCPAGAGSCTQGEQAGEAIARLAGPSPRTGRVDRLDLASRRRGQRRSGDRVGSGDAALRPGAAAAGVRRRRRPATRRSFRRRSRTRSPGSPRARSRSAQRVEHLADARHPEGRQPARRADRRRRAARRQLRAARDRPRPGAQ